MMKYKNTEKKLLLLRSLIAACCLMPIAALAQLPNVGMLANINPGSSSGNPGNLTKLGSLIIFSANDGTNGTELWKSDGTLAGTQLVKDIRSGSSSSSPGNFVVMGSYVYFTANDGVNGGALWRTDGTLAGTTLVKDVNPTSATTSAFISNLAVIGSKLYFRGNDGTNGEEPWTSDGTPGGTTMLKNINTGAGAGSSNSTDPFACTCSGTFEFVEFNGHVYFNASDGANSGQNSELWRTDGTNAGTVLFKDNYSFGSGAPANLVNAGTYLFFTSDNQANTGYEPWKSDGTVVGTVMIKDIFTTANVGSITGDVPTAFMNGYVYFVAIDVYDPNNGNLDPPQSVFINAELWRTDGTFANTTKVKEINPGMTGTTADAFPNNFFVYNNKLYFSATDGTNGTEPWVTDGTSANTIMLKNIDLAGSSSPGNFTLFNSFVYFSADDNAANGVELWRTDGTTGNTVLVNDINPGAANGSPSNFAVLDANHMLLRGTHAAIGSELYILGGYKVAVTTSANGQVAPPGSGSTSNTIDVGIKSGGSQNFVFTPNPTYSVQSVLVNGSSVGAPSSYNFTTVTSNQTLNVTFALGPPPCPTITFNATPTNTCTGSNTGQIVVSGVSGGATPYQYSKDNGANYQSGATFSSLSAATYQVVVKDANACTSGATPVVVGTYPAQSAAFGYANTGFCQAGTDPSPTIYGNTGGTFTAPGAVNINASSGVIDVSASTAGGPYTVTYTTTGPCTATATFAVSIVNCDPGATLGDAFVTDNKVTGKADPGDRIRLTSTISNSQAADYEGVQLTLNNDPIVTLVSGSFKTTPVAVDNAYTTTINTMLNVAVGIGVLVNDFDNAVLNVTAFSNPSAQGGTVSVSANGGFTYNPPNGFTGNDTFTYTITDSDGQTDTATVRIRVN